MYRFSFHFISQVVLKDTQEVFKSDLQQNGVFREPSFLHVDFSQVRSPTPASPVQLYLDERNFSDSLFAELT